MLRAKKLQNLPMFYGAIQKIKVAHFHGHGIQRRFDTRVCCHTIRYHALKNRRLPSSIQHTEQTEIGIMSMCIINMNEKLMRLNSVAIRIVVG